jgi:hypothetical protein
MPQPVPNSQETGKRKVIDLKPEDRVRILTKRFGDRYAVGKPKFTFGKVVKVNDKAAEVEWDSPKGEKGWKWGDGITLVPFEKIKSHHDGP